MIWHSLGKERSRPFFFGAQRELKAIYNGDLSIEDKLAETEDMARKLLNEDEVAAILRHCRRVCLQYATFPMGQEIFFKGQSTCCKLYFPGTSELI